MAKRGKAKSSVNNDIEAYRHKADNRRNAVPVGLVSCDTSKPKPKKYEYDPHLDLQLLWAGKAEPSKEDIAITQRLMEVGKIVGIEVIDHVICNKNGHFSFQAEGMLKGGELK